MQSASQAKRRARQSGRPKAALVRRPEGDGRQASDTLAVVDVRLAKLRGAMRRDLSDRQVIGLLSGLRKEIFEFQMQLVTARLAQLSNGSVEWQRTSSAELLGLLKARREADVNDVEASLAAPNREVETEE